MFAGGDTHLNNIFITYFFLLILYVYFSLQYTFKYVNMYVYVHVYVHTYIHTYICIYIYGQAIIYMCLGSRRYTFIYNIFTTHLLWLILYVYIHIYALQYVFLHVHVYIYVHECIYVYICVHVCICICMCMCICECIFKFKYWQSATPEERQLANKVLAGVSVFVCVRACGYVRTCVSV